MKHLKLKDDKTECLTGGKGGDLRRLEDIHNLTSGGTEIDVKRTVKDLDVMLDSKLSEKKQINKAVREAIPLVIT